MIALRLFQDFEPEAPTSHPAMRGMPLTYPVRNAILPIPMGKALMKAVSEFLTIGIAGQAFLAGCVKGGGGQG